MKTFTRRSIRANLVLLVVLILLPLFIILFYFSIEQKKNSIEFVRQNAIRIAHDLALKQKNIEENTRQFLGILSQLKEIKEKDTLKVTSILSNLMSQNPAYASLLQVNKNGDLVASGLGYVKLNVSNCKYFRDVKRTKSFSISDYTSCLLTNKPVINYAFPVFGSDSIVESILIASFDLNYCNSIFNITNLGDDVVFTCIDHNGRIIYQTSDSFINSGKKENLNIRNTIMNGKSSGSFIAKGHDNIERLYGYYNINLPNHDVHMTIIVGIPFKIAIGKYQKSLTKFTLIWIFAGLIIILIAYLFAINAIVKPIDKLVDVSRSIADGNLQARIGKIKNPSSELGKLSKAIDEMTEKLLQREMDRYKVEKDLNKLKERFELAINSANIGIWDWHIRNNSLIWDKNMFHLYEIDPEAFNNTIQGWYSLIHPDDLEAFTLEINQAIKEEKPFRSEFKIKSSSKALKHIRIYADVILDKELKPVRLIGVNWDITERKSLERKLHLAREKAETSDKLKSTFLANISHEIRTPLHGIIGFAQILKNEDVTRKERIQYLDIIINSGNKLVNIISNIIDISLLDAGQLKLIEKEYYVGDVLKEIYDSFISLKIQENKEFQFILEKLPNTGMNIFVDNFRFKQIFNNLIENAFKFTENGEIRIGCYQSEGYYTFYVKDTGIGIKKENINKIFQRFKQVDEGYNRNYYGNGLGLSITKGLVELMGGKIWIEQKNQGTDFYFSVPVKNDPNEAIVVEDETEEHLF